MQMKNIEIIFYSFIQGISEFLPISSSAHLYVIESFFKWEIEGLTFALAAHLGTLLAVLFFEKSLSNQFCYPPKFSANQL